jgi:hypothetical protein
MSNNTALSKRSRRVIALLLAVQTIRQLSGRLFVELSYLLLWSLVYGSSDVIRIKYSYSSVRLHSDSFICYPFEIVAIKKRHQFVWYFGVRQSYIKRKNSGNLRNGITFDRGAWPQWFMAQSKADVIRIVLVPNLCKSDFPCWDMVNQTRPLVWTRLPSNGHEGGGYPTEVPHWELVLGQNFTVLAEPELFE